MFHRQYRQFNSAHAAHFTCPQTTSVDYVFCVNGVVFVGNDIPCSVCALAEAGHPRLGVHLGSAVASANCVSMCYSVWVYRAFVFVIQRTYEILLFEQRVELFCFLHRQHFHVHAQVTTAGLRHLQPVETLWCVGKLQAAGQVNAAVLARLLLNFLVQIDGVLLQSGNVWVAIECVHAAGGVPCGTSSQLFALEQNNVRPASLGEVIQHGGAYNAATDNYYACRRFHRFNFLLY